MEFKFLKITLNILKLIALLLTPALTFAKLNTYQAQYALHYKGYKIGTGIHHIYQTGPQIYKIEFTAKPSFFLLPFKYFERSEFELATRKIIPKIYQFDTKQGYKISTGDLSYNWSLLQLHGLVNKKAVNYPIKNNLHDNLSFVLQLQQDLQYNPNLKTFDYEVFDKGKIKNYHLKVVSTEIIETDMGKMNTLKLIHQSKDGKRTTLLWLGLDNDYILVQIQQNYKGHTSTGATLQSIKLLKPD